MRITPGLTRIFETPGPVVSVSDFAPSAAGALVLATLAYPEMKHTVLRREAALRLVLKFGRSNDPREHDVAGFAAELEDITRLENRLRKRLDAGLLALQAFVAIERREKPIRVRGGRWNLAAAMRDSTDGGPDAVKNFARRTWEPSAAVIHLASAWAGMILAAQKAGQSFEDGLIRIMRHPAYREELLGKAMALEEMIEACQMGIPRDILIKFRP
jgi:hypothetical protein